MHHQHWRRRPGWIDLRLARQPVGVECGLGIAGGFEYVAYRRFYSGAGDRHRQWHYQWPPRHALHAEIGSRQLCAYRGLLAGRHEHLHGAGLPAREPRDAGDASERVVAGNGKSVPNGGGLRQCRSSWHGMSFQSATVANGFPWGRRGDLRPPLRFAGENVSASVSGFQIAASQVPTLTVIGENESLPFEGLTLATSAGERARAAGLLRQQFGQRRAGRALAVHHQPWQWRTGRPDVRRAGEPDGPGSILAGPG